MGFAKRYAFLEMCSVAKMEQLMCSDVPETTLGVFNMQFGCPEHKISSQKYYFVDYGGPFNSKSHIDDFDYFGAC